MKPLRERITLFRLLRWCLYLLLATVIFIVSCNLWIVNSTRDQLYTDVSLIPARKTGLVLGANKNLYFYYRINAAAELYKHGKVKYLLVSGDNHTEGYDEPTEMKNALIAHGIPDTCIYLDYAGFRTFDSMVRCRDVFGEDTITVISQPFHNQRAVFIANHEGMNAIGFNAENVHHRTSFKTKWREYFAKVKCVLDLYLFGTKPKFLGEPITIGDYKTQQISKH